MDHGTHLVDDSPYLDPSLRRPRERVDLELDVELLFQQRETFGRLREIEAGEQATRGLFVELAEVVESAVEETPKTPTDLRGRDRST